MNFQMVNYDPARGCDERFFASQLQDERFEDFWRQDEDEILSELIEILGAKRIIEVISGDERCIDIIYERMGDDEFA